MLGRQEFQPQLFATVDIEKLILSSLERATKGEGIAT